MITLVFFPVPDVISLFVFLLASVNLSQPTPALVILFSVWVILGLWETAHLPLP